MNVLHALTQAHALAIPFENVDVLLGRPILLEPAALYHKLVEGHRGGYCFEQNGLFLEVLTRLGFHVRPLRAAVRLREPDRRLPVGHTHLVLEVEIDGELWITDVGVGSDSLTRALRFTPGIEQATPHETRRLDHADGRWFHQTRHGEAWVDVYEFGGDTMALPDRLIANWWVSTSPDSKFRRELFVSRALPNGRRVSLHNRELTLRRADGAAMKRMISGNAELLEALREHFGIVLPGGTQLKIPALDEVRGDAKRSD